MPSSNDRHSLALGLLAAAALLPVRVTAQTSSVVDPPLFRYMPGGTVTGFPFGYPKRRVVRYQEIHDQLAGSSRSINSISLRRTADMVTIPAFKATCSMRLSTATNQAAKISSSFANNTGPDVSTVIKTRSISFPENVPAGPGILPAFSYTLPTDQPFAFMGKGPLCLELLVTTHTNRTPFKFDLYQQGYGYLASIGAACGGLDLSTGFEGGKVVHQTTGLPADAPLLFLAGAPLRDPIDLKPLGAPGCSQLITLPILLPAFATSSGTHEIEFSLQAAQSGDAYAAQIMAIKPGLNALGAVLSQANLVLPIGPRNLGRLWAEAATASTGTAQPVFGLVLRID